MLPRDIDDLINVTQPAVSPDGGMIAFVVTRVDAPANDYRSQIWTVPADGSAPAMPFTSGEHKDANPTWSPDGGRLAFTSSRGKGEKVKASLHVAPVRTGGEVVTLAKLTEGAKQLRWSPDGRYLALVTRTRDGRYDEEDDSRRPPRRVTRLFSRLDDVGHTSDRPQHVYVVPADGSAPPRNLTPGEFEFSDPAWGADSRCLLVAGATHDTWDLDRKVDVHAIDVVSGQRRVLTGTKGVYSSPAISPDARRIALLGTDDAETYPRNTHVAVMRCSGVTHTWVSDRLDRTFATSPGRPPLWLDDDRLLVSVEDRGDVHLYLVFADGAAPPEPVWDGTGCVTGFDAAGRTIACTLSTATRPGELYVLDYDGPRRLTDITARFADLARLQEYDQLAVKSSDGRVELDAWMLKPPGFDPERRYPMLVNVHGGPFSQYTNGFFDEVQMQARAGHVVLWCNPRGSSGREESFGRAITGPPLGGTGWGSVDFEDLMTVVDHVLAEARYVDPERVGILGGSYGGYLTSWAVGHTDRFRAACSERGVSNLQTLESTSDVAGAFRTWMGVSHLDDPELYARHSPISYVHDVTTPLLILHSEEDLRCPVAQADQLFVALRLLGKEVEMLRFSGEGHELSRSGSPAHRRQRMEAILEFFGRHLNHRTGGPRHVREDAWDEPPP